MTRIHLTQRRVDALKPKAKVYSVRDSELTGFGVQVQPSGTRRYVIQTQHDGRRFFRVVGDADSLPTEEARTHAKEAIVTIKRGNPWLPSTPASSASRASQTRSSGATGDA